MLSLAMRHSAIGRLHRQQRCLADIWLFVVSDGVLKLHMMEFCFLQMLQAGLAESPERAAGWLALVTLRQGLGPAAPIAPLPNPTAALVAADAGQQQLAKQALSSGESRQAGSALALLKTWAHLEQGDTDQARGGFQKLIGMQSVSNPVAHHTALQNYKGEASHLQLFLWLPFCLWVKIMLCLKHCLSLQVILTLPGKRARQYVACCCKSVFTSRLQSIANARSHKIRLIVLQISLHFHQAENLQYINALQRALS